jgi:hypothetical protein
MKNLEIMGVQEMDSQDLQIKFGGWFWVWFFGSMGGGLMYDLFSDPGAITRGVEKAMNEPL